MIYLFYMYGSFRSRVLYLLLWLFYLFLSWGITYLFYYNNPCSFLCAFFLNDGSFENSSLFKPKMFLKSCSDKYISKQLILIPWCNFKKSTSFISVLCLKITCNSSNVCSWLIRLMPVVLGVVGLARGGARDGGGGGPLPDGGGGGGPPKKCTKVSKKRRSEQM